MLANFDFVNETNSAWASPVYFEYTSAANPKLPPIPGQYMRNSAGDHRDGNHPDGAFKTVITPIDLRAQLQTEYPATSPACLVSFVQISAGDELELTNQAASNLLVVISGSASLESDFGSVEIQRGDILSIPYSQKLIAKAHQDCRIYAVNDLPLLNYLGVRPTKANFQPTLYPYQLTVDTSANYNQDAQAQTRNRNGVLLANPACPLTKTITPTLWALYNIIAPHSVQAPHQHNSVALDLCFTAEAGVYSLLSEKIDANGNLINPQRMDWIPGAAFITPPAWWHSHHNESASPAVVIPIQDAGLQTYLRTLFIKFSGAKRD